MFWKSYLRSVCVKIIKLEVRNYRTFDNCEFTFHSNINFVVGRNNIGKSNLLILFKKLLVQNRFTNEDFNDNDTPIEGLIVLKLEENEFGIFEDYFNPNNSSEISFSFTQNNPYEELEIIHSETNMPLPKSSLKTLNYIYYDSNREPDRNHDFQSETSNYNLVPFLIEKYYKNNEPLDLFSNDDDISNLLTYLNTSLTKIDTINSDRINVTIEKDNSIDSIKKVMFLGNEDNIPINKLGSGIQYTNMIPLNILSNLINRSRYKKTFEEMIKHDENDRSYVEFIMGIDEPEIHLHPHLQKKLIKYILDIFSGNNENFNNLLKTLFNIDYIKGQLIVATHSPNILLEDYKSIIRLYLYESTVSAKCGKEIIIDSESEKKFLLKYMPFIKNAFFSKTIIIVEGDTELLAIQTFASKKNIDLDTFEIEVVSADGKESIPTLSNLFNKFSINTVSIFDKDTDNPSNPSYNTLPNVFFTNQKEFEDDILASMHGIDFLNFILETGSNNKTHTYESLLVEDSSLKEIKEKSYNLDHFIFNLKVSYEAEEISLELIHSFFQRNLEIFTWFTKKDKSILKGELLAEHVTDIPDIYKNALERAVRLSDE